MALSTRQKIKSQWRAAKSALENCRYHLMYLYNLAEGESKFITKKLPPVLLALEEMDKVLDAFREGI